MIVQICKEENTEINNVVFSKSSEFILTNDIYDAVFLDIEMPEMNGFDVATEINKKNRDTLIIFTSMHNNFVFKSFEYAPFSFLRKDELNNDLRPLLKRILIKLDKNNYVIEISTSDGLISLKISDIYYIEVIQHTLIFHTENDSFYTRKPLALIEKELLNRGFIRSHKSYLVNCNKINKLDKSSIILDNTKIIPLSRSFEKSVQDKFYNLLRGEI
jgi:DNA-binding LytR/AlgR family response regulator